MLFARVGPTEAKCLLSLVTLSECEGSLMEVMDFLLFDLRASMLLIPSHVFFILVKLESKNLK